MQIKWPAVVRFVGGKELPRQKAETTEQIIWRRGTLISLDLLDCPENQPRAIGVMPYMADL